MAAAHHQHALAGITIAPFPEHVGNAVGNLSAQCAFTQGGQAGSAKEVGILDGARGVDHALGKHLVLPVGVPVLHDVGLCAAAGILHQVTPVAGDAQHAGTQAQPRRYLRGGSQGPQVAFDHLAAGRERSQVRLLPAPGGQQAAGLAVDGELPGRKHAHVRPALHAGADRIAGFEQKGLQAARKQVGGGGQADRAGADDDNGKRGVHDDLLWTPGPGFNW